MWEVVSLQRGESTKRSMEASESVLAESAIEAAGGEDDDDEDDLATGPSRKRRQVNIGVEKTALEGLLKTLEEKGKAAFRAVETDSTECMARLVRVYGNDDGHLTGGPSEQWEELKTSLAATKAKFQAMTDLFPAFTQRCKDAESMNHIRTISGEAAMSFSNVKKDEASVQLRGLLTKMKRSLTQHEKTSAKERARVAAEADGKAVSASATAKAPIAVVIQEMHAAYTGNGAGWSMSFFDPKCGIRLGKQASCTKKKDASSLVDAIRKNQYVKQLSKQCADHLKERGGDSICAVCQDLVKGARVKKLIKSAFDVQITTSLVLPDESWAKRIFDPEVVQSQSTFNSIWVSGNGTCEVRVYLHGAEILVGIPLRNISGTSLSEKRAQISAITAAQLKNMVDECHGWVIKATAEEDCAYLIPSGHMLLQTSEGAGYIRWGVSCDDQDTQRVSSVVQDIIASYPEYAGPTTTLAQWGAWLTENYS